MRVQFIVDTIYRNTYRNMYVERTIRDRAHLR